MAAIFTEHLQKQYRRIQALKDLSLRVEEGEIFGLLGRNGAGKTTLVKILLGMVRPTSGQAQVLNQVAGSLEARKHIGFLAEDHRFPDYHTGWSLLDFYAGLMGVSRRDRLRKIPAMLERVRLSERQHYKIRTYSKGMKQRLGIAQALLHEPRVVFLDEPTDGVDPVGRREIRQVLQELKERKATVFINSHLLSEVEMICDRVGILNHGVMVKEGSVEALTRQQHCYILGLAKGQGFPALLEGGPSFRLTPRKDGLYEVELPPDQSIDSVVDLIRSRQLSIRHLVEKQTRLEDLFLEVVDVEAIEA
jgi:ABC-2 type transport system ATP-binding protein